MKKIVIMLIMFIQSFLVQAIFIGINESTSQNSFLGQTVNACSNKNYNCSNETISGILNVDFFSPQNYGKQLYIFNDFIYWVGAQNKAEEYAHTVQRFSGSALDKKMDDDFPVPGTYMIVLGTSDYLKKIIAPTKTCPSGQWLMMAQLKYNNGKMIYAWSQDSICLAPKDSFSLQISSDADNTIPFSSNVTTPPAAPDAQGIDWMKDTGPDAAMYNKASKSARKIRLVKSS
ncbi:hypothetical protein [Candidatus Chromulinivorax destructor]|nr:hypothetical protein [Candidatus Chromulinivorax destructor]